ncbi:hypothetical protein ACQY0O_001632 [Thecaphora frezii]
MNTVKKVLSSGTSSKSSVDNVDDRRHSHSTAATSDSIHNTHHHNYNNRSTLDKIEDKLEGNKTHTTTATHSSTKSSMLPGIGRSADVHTKDGLMRHSHGHEYKNDHLDLTRGDVDQDVQHLTHVTKERHHRHEVEEVERQKEAHKHIHHVQHHTQPIIDSEHSAEQVHNKVVPHTHIAETHASTDKDAALLTSVAGKHKDEYYDAGTDRKIVDKGEKINEHIHHHIHNVVQPIVEKDSHEYHRIKTIIPSTVVTHEAPIVHESTSHKPISKADFLSGGGKLNSTITSVHDANLLNTGKCERTVSGVAEQLERELGLGRTSSPRPQVV